MQAWEELLKFGGICKRRHYLRRCRGELLYGKSADCTHKSAAAGYFCYVYYGAQGRILP